MSDKDSKLKLWYAPVVDFIVDRRGTMALAVIMISAALGYCIPGMKADVTLKSGVNMDEPTYRRYLEFVELFGHEEFVLAAIKKSSAADDGAMLKAVETITRKLEGHEKIVEVTSLANLKVFQERKGRYGVYGVVRDDGSGPALPAEKDLARIRQALPIVDLLLSRDGNTFGIIMRIDEEWRFAPKVIEEIIRDIRTVISGSIPPGSDFRIIGFPVIRTAIHKYNIQTAITFGVLCTLICTLVSFYIFKSLRAAFITFTVVALCDWWILGFMSLMHIEINSVTALAFGLVLISSVEPVIHLVTHFNDRLRSGDDRATAAKNALRMAAGPCLTTSFTTSFGFSSLIVASIPMVRQLGVILALGPLMAFVLAMVVAPAFLTFMRQQQPKIFDKMAADLLTSGFARTERLVLRRPRALALGIFALIGLMLCGAPWIRTDTQLMRLLTPSTPEIQDIRFVEANLCPTGSLALVLEADEDAFKKPETWKKVKAVEQRLKTIPEVFAAESLLPLLEYMQELVGGPDGKPGDLFSDERAIPQLLTMMSLNTGGKRMVDRFLEEQRFSQLRISVRIKNSPHVKIADTIEQIRAAAQAEMAGTAKVVITGDLAVVEAQASDLVGSQTYSLLMAVFYMSMLLTIQFRSLALGIMSLLPQILPQAVIFGTMGWLGIPLDQVTVFTASISIGLTVDNTVHYLTHLKRQMQASTGDPDVPKCLAAAYDVTARAMISNHAVIFFGFAMLLISPYQPVIYLGALGTLAIMFSLIGDLVFVPSAILASSRFRRLLTRELMVKRSDKKLPPAATNTT